MYLSFYELQKKPFQNNADPSFLWLGEKHEEALAILKYGILENQGFLLLTSEMVKECAKDLLLPVSLYK